MVLAAVAGFAARNPRITQAVLGGIFGESGAEKAQRRQQAAIASMRLEIDGMDEIRRTLRAAGGMELQKELGQVHKHIGTMVIRQAGGADTNVGEGAGSTLRPSASSREVLLRVGGAHRDSNAEQWGKQQTWPPPERPNIIGSAEEIQDKIEDEYWGGVERILKRGAFV